VLTHRQTVATTHRWLQRARFRLGLDFAFRLRAAGTVCLDLDARLRGPSGERGLRRCKPCDRHAVRRARYVIEADAMAEPHRCRIAAVLAADAELQIRP